MTTQKSKMAADGVSFTTDPITTQPSATGEPEFIRLPLRGLCPRSQLSRAKIYQLINAGKIKSVCLRERGQKKGCRLVHWPSLRAYLHRLLAEQNSDVQG